MHAIKRTLLKTDGVCAFCLDFVLAAPLPYLGEGAGQLTLLAAAAHGTARYMHRQEEATLTS